MDGSIVWPRSSRYGRLLGIGVVLESRWYVYVAATAIVGILVGFAAPLLRRRSSRTHRSALAGLPSEIAITGYGTVTFGPWEAAREFARRYVRSARLPFRPIKTYAKVIPERARRIAAAYDAMADDPLSPQVAASYRAMIDETLAQHQFVKKTGLVIELIKPDQPDPYRVSPRLAILDVVQNNHYWLYPTSVGFGHASDGSYTDSNPLLGPTDESVGDIPLCVNDVFRIVHDYFGHIQEGVGFRADGEENAWRCHSTMYSRAALGAITTELRGQNSWVNYGPHGDKNRTASAETVFAVQKIGLMPIWVWDEGREG